jgi:toxin ParE1/3/4
MTFELVVRNRATQDIRRQANYILANGNRNAAERFLEFAEHSFSQLVANPNTGKVIPLSLSNEAIIRQWRIKNFKDYLIFYMVQEDRVEVLRVLHGARDLGDILPFFDEEM